PATPPAEFLAGHRLGGVVRVLVAGAVAQPLHERRGRIPEVERNGQGAGGRDVGGGGDHGARGGVRLGAGGKIGGRLREREPPFREADEVHRVLRRDREREPLRLGSAHV